MKHPIDITKNYWLEVFCLNHWMLATYEGWEPITEDNMCQPKIGGKYRIVYKVNFVHVYYNKLSGIVDNIHSSRIRPVKLKENKARMKILEKELYGEI